MADGILHLPMCTESKNPNRSTTRKTPQTFPFSPNLSLFPHTKTVKRDNPFRDKPTFHAHCSPTCADNPILAIKKDRRESDFRGGPSFQIHFPFIATRDGFLTYTVQRFYDLQNQDRKRKIPVIKHSVPGTPRNSPLKNRYAVF